MSSTNGTANGRLKDGKNGSASPQASGAPEARDRSTGKFLLGNPGGPGRPRNPWTRCLTRRRQLLLATVTDEAFVEVINGVVGKARAGDVAAARLILEFCCGKV